MNVLEKARAAKKRYFEKKYKEAPEIECGCGCGQIIKSVDNYGRSKGFVSGHNNRKYDHEDPQASKKAWVKRNRSWANFRRKSISISRKIELIGILGGCCEVCQLKYDGTNGAAFEFHHKDSKDKSFTIGKSLTDKSMEDLIEEVAKCQLLCSNCHQIHHIGNY